MTVLDAINSVVGSQMEKVTLKRRGTAIFEGTILNLLERKDLLDLEIKSEFVFQIGKGYIGNVL